MATVWFGFDRQVVQSFSGASWAPKECEMTKRIAALIVALLAAGCGGSDEHADGALKSARQMRATGVAMTTQSATATVTADMTLDWAEYSFPDDFPKAIGMQFPAVFYDGVTYNARLYAGAWGERYLGITPDGRIFGLGDFTGGTLMQFNDIDYWAPQVLASQCSISPESCLNSVPVAHAGPLQNVTKGMLVTLNGGASTDANGDPMTFLWSLTTKPTGSAAALSNPTSARPDFTADVSGIYVASLVVSDGKASSAPVAVTVKSVDVNAFDNVGAGSYYSTVLKSNGTVWTWGYNMYGSLGDGSPTGSPDWFRSIPAAVPELTGVIAVSVAVERTMALKSDGSVVAWGGGIDTTPVALRGLANVIQVSGGGGCSYGLALKSDGTVVTLLPTSLGGFVPEPVQGLTGVVQVSAGCLFSLALKADGTVVAWGSYAGGVLADGTVVGSDSPIPVVGLSGVAKVVATPYAEHALALKSDGTVWSWGGNGSGQLGNGTLVARWTPQAVQGLTDVVSVAAGNAHSAAVKSDGTVMAWGANGLGQLGDGTRQLRTLPVPLLGINDVATIAVGNFHTIATKADGTVWGWGYNQHGQLGIGTNNPAVVVSPRAVLGAFNLGN